MGYRLFLILSVMALSFVCSTHIVCCPLHVPHKYLDVFHCRLGLWYLYD